MGWLFSSGSLSYFLSNLRTEEAGMVLAGLAGGLAWILTAYCGWHYATTSKRPWLFRILFLFYYPLVPLAAGVYVLEHNPDATEAVESATAKP